MNATVTAKQEYYSISHTSKSYRCIWTFREPFAALSRSIHICHWNTQSLAWVLERLPYAYKYTGVSENSVPLTPMVNDHYPY